MLRDFFLCRILHWHLSELLAAQHHLFYADGVSVEESDTVLPTGEKTFFLYECQRCKKRWVRKVDGNWTEIDDDDNGDSINIPTPEDLERMMR